MIMLKNRPTSRWEEGLRSDSARMDLAVQIVNRHVRDEGTHSRAFDPDGALVPLEGGPPYSATAPLMQCLHYLSPAGYLPAPPIESPLRTIDGVRQWVVHCEHRAAFGPTPTAAVINSIIDAQPGGVGLGCDDAPRRPFLDEITEIDGRRWCSAHNGSLTVDVDMVTPQIAGVGYDPRVEPKLAERIRTRPQVALMEPMALTGWADRRYPVYTTPSGLMVSLYPGAARTLCSCLLYFAAGMVWAVRPGSEIVVGAASPAQTQQG